jgi:hypothetical protein
MRPRPKRNIASHGGRRRQSEFKGLPTAHVVAFRWFTNFAADGDYVFRFSFHHETTGTAVGIGASALNTTPESPEQVEISVDGERVALMDIDRWMRVSESLKALTCERRRSL